MAIKKIRMRPEGTNDYADVLHPETSAEQVIMNSGETLENTIDTHLAESVTQAHMPQNVGLGNVDNVKQASKTEFDVHNNDATRHMTSVERTKWNTVDNKVDKVTGKGLSSNDYTTAEKNKLSGIQAGAEVNQNAFSNVKIGTTTISADTKSDTLEFVAGTGITLTPDATNDKVTITGVNQYTHPATHPASMITGLPTSLPANGGNSTTVNGHTVYSDVPANVKWQTFDFDNLGELNGCTITSTQTADSYIDTITLSATNKKVADRTETKTDTEYITVIRVYKDDGITVDKTTTIRESITDYRKVIE